jgi:prophage antirepressor-like protein
MEQIFRNQKLNVSVRTVRWENDVLFYAKDIAESLGYADPKKAVQKLVRKQNKIRLEGLTKGGESPPLVECHPHTILLYEPGLYQLIFNSRLPLAEGFQDWVFRDVLPSIRKTGSYSLPKPRSLQDKQLKLINETDLHYQVVKHIRKRYPNVIITPGLGEYQDSSEKRCDAWSKGYTGGQPDIILMEPSNGFHGYALELKTPKGTGVVSEKQKCWMNKLSSKGFQTLISNDYAEIILDIDKYFIVDETKELRDEITKLEKKCKRLEKKVVPTRPAFLISLY